MSSNESERSIAIGQSVDGSEPEWRAERPVFLQGFVRLITAGCLAEPGIRVIGSWRTREPHLARGLGGSYWSFSDVDVVYEDAISDGMLKYFSNNIEEEFKRRGLVLRKVSLRRASLIAQLPHGLATTIQGHSMRRLDPRSMMFWTAISGIESSVLCKEALDDKRTGASHYVAAKFLLNALRNVALFEGNPLLSYRSILTWAKQRTEPSALMAAYRTKVGCEHDDDGYQLEHLLQTGLSSIWLAVQAKDAQFQNLCAIARHHALLLNCGGQLEPDSYLEWAENCACEESHDEVLEYQRRKLDKANAHACE